MFPSLSKVSLERKALTLFFIIDIKPPPDIASGTTAADPTRWRHRAGRLNFTHF